MVVQTSSLRSRDSTWCAEKQPDPRSLPRMGQPLLASSRARGRKPYAGSKLWLFSVLIKPFSQVFLFTWGSAIMEEGTGAYWAHAGWRNPNLTQTLFRRALRWKTVWNSDTGLHLWNRGLEKNNFVTWLNIIPSWCICAVKGPGTHQGLGLQTLWNQ